jgi:hypothetical protein
MMAPGIPTAQAPLAWASKQIVTPNGLTQDRRPQMAAAIKPGGKATPEDESATWTGGSLSVAVPTVRLPWLREAQGAYRSARSWTAPLGRHAPGLASFTLRDLCLI